MTSVPDPENLPRLRRARDLAAGAAGALAYKNADDLFAARVRELFQSNDEIRDSGLTAPDDVVRVTDIAYGEDPAQVLDIYYPAGAAGAAAEAAGGPLPTIISVHGGGYVYGDKERYQYYCMSLAQRGFAVVNFSYRLAPEFRFPAQLTDVNLVMQHIARHAGEYSIDTDNLFMVGDSAGAQLASQYLAAMSNPAYADLLELEIPPLKVRACALNCGLYSFNPRKDRMMARCYFEGPAKQYAEKMDVAGNITGGFPPAFVMTSTGDFLRERAAPFAAVLTRAGVEAELHEYGDEENKPGHVFHCNMKDPLAHRCNDDECECFRRHMV